MPESISVSQIESYSMRVLRGQVSCDLPPCLQCQTLSSFFDRHEARDRTFHVLCEEFIHTVLCLLTRWKCTGCGKTFTQYPPFAFPYKRYTRQTIMELSRRYVEYDSLSYRAVVLNQGMALGYAATIKDAGGIDERQLVPSTLHRWISTLGSLQKTLRSALELILQDNPTTRLYRDLAGLTVSPRKYRTSARRFLLKCCRQIIHTDSVYLASFHTSIFPNLATSCGWR